MKKVVMILMVLFMSTSVFAGGNIYKKTLAEEESHSPWPGDDFGFYDHQCPYGDVVVIRKGYENLSDKHGLIYDCVYHHSGDKYFTIRDYDFYTKEFVIRHINPEEYRVFVMDGELRLNNGKVQLLKQD